MNAPIRIESSVACDTALDWTLFDLPQGARNAEQYGTKTNNNKMTTQRIHHRKWLLFMAACLVFATAVPMMPYIWNDWKRNISWIRYQEITSDLVKTIPKATPMRA